MADTIELDANQTPPEEGFNSPTFSKMLDKFKLGLEEVRTGKEADAPAPIEKVAPAPDAKAKEVLPKIDDAPAAKPAVSPDADELPPGTSAKAGEKFAALKKSRNEWQAKHDEADKNLKALQVEVERLKKVSPDATTAAELEKTRAELKTYQEQLRVASIERDPRFKEYFDGKTNGVLDYVKQRLPGDVSTKIINALNLPEGEYRAEKLRDVLAELDDFQRSVVADADKSLWAIRNERNAELSKAAKEYDSIQARDKAALESRKAQETAAQAQKREATVNVVLANASQFDSFKPIEGDAAHNAELEIRKKFVTDWHNDKVDEKLKSFAPVVMAHSVYLQEVVIPKMQAELDKLRAQSAAITKATPAAATSGKPAAAKPANEKKSFMERYKEEMAAT